MALISKSPKRQARTHPGPPSVLREQGGRGSDAPPFSTPEIRLRFVAVMLSTVSPAIRFSFLSNAGENLQPSAMSATTPANRVIPIPGGTSVRPNNFPKTPVSMKSELIDKAAKVIPHPPLLINLVSRRVRQLNQGRAPLINVASHGTRLGQGDIALIEIIEGKITAQSVNDME